jgi:hypothetical protein
VSLIKAHAERRLSAEVSPWSQIMEETMNKIQSTSHWTSLALLAGLLIPLLSGITPAAAQVGTIPANHTVWQHVGRIYLNPTTGQAVYAGYVVHLNGIDSSLFNGAPGEGTAYFTFKTDILQLTPLPNNGDVSLYFVSAGTFSVYYNPSPNGNWGDPDTFSSGELIATFERKESLYPVIGPLGLHSLSESLVSSKNFTFEGHTYNFNRISPDGITFAQFFSSTPLAGAGITGYPVVFPGAGAVTAVGSRFSVLGPSE